MPRYYFHTSDDLDYTDEVGTDVSDIRRLRSLAVNAAAEALTDRSRAWQGSKWRMCVVDESGDAVLTLDFAVSDHRKFSD